MMRNEREKKRCLTRLSETERINRPRFQEIKKKSRPITRDLEERGFVVDVVSDLYHRSLNYKKAIPTLIKWLPVVDDIGIKEEIVRALSVRWAKPSAALPLIREYTLAPQEPWMGLKWAIGNALSVLADDSVFDELRALALDRKHGRSREMVVSAFGNMKDPRAVPLLIQLLDDDEVAGHALSALRTLAPVEARIAIQPFLDHPRTWWRNEAKRALKNIDKSGVIDETR